MAIGAPDKRGPGRPKKSHHKRPVESVAAEEPGRPSPKPVKPVVPRKPRSAIVDREHAMKRDAENYNVLARAHNAEHPDRAAPLIDLASCAGLAPMFSAEQCAMMGTTGAEMLGQAWGIRTRPKPEAIVSWGHAAAEASKFAPQVPPVWVAVGGLVLCTLIAVAPMYKAREMVRRGEREDPERCGGAGVVLQFVPDPPVTTVPEVDAT